MHDRPRRDEARARRRSAALLSALCVFGVPPAQAQQAQPQQAQAQQAQPQQQSLETNVKEGADTKPEPHYDDGFVLVPTIDPDLQPFRLKVKHVSQFKYTNSKNVNDTYTDHLGNV